MAGFYYQIWFKIGFQNERNISFNFWDFIIKFSVILPRYSDFIFVSLFDFFIQFYYQKCHWLDFDWKMVDKNIFQGFGANIGFKIKLLVNFISNWNWVHIGYYFTNWRLLVMKMEFIWDFRDFFTNWSRIEFKLVFIKLCVLKIEIIIGS